MTNQVQALFRRFKQFAVPASVFGVFFLGSMASYGQSPAGGKLEPYVLTLPGSVVKIHMVPIAGGKITIRGKEVTVPPYYIAETETPWEAYDVFLDSGPASKPYDQTNYAPDAVARPSKSYILPDLGWGHHGYPVINVSFISVQMFCRWLSAATKQKYRLPTEAEWEIACRAGDMGPWHMDKAALDKNVWYAANAGGTTHPVGTKLANKFGLFDMLGNVGNWATDLDGKSILCGASYKDDSATVSPLTRRRWQPSWQQEDPQIPKSRWWLSDGSFVGFRVVCEPG